MTDKLLYTSKHNDNISNSTLKRTFQPRNKWCRLLTDDPHPALVLTAGDVRWHSRPTKHVASVHFSTWNVPGHLHTWWTPHNDWIRHQN